MSSSSASSEPSAVDPLAGLPVTVNTTVTVPVADVPVTAPPLLESSVLQLATAVADLIQDYIAAGRNPLKLMPLAVFQQLP